MSRRAIAREVAFGLLALGFVWGGVAATFHVADDINALLSSITDWSRP